MREYNQNFWNLVEPLHAATGAFCRKLMGDRDEGDDLYQEAIYKALTRFEQLRDPEAFRPWLYRIITNCHRNRVATHWWRRFVRLGRSHESIPIPGDLAEQVEARRRLEVALKPLSPKDRTLLLLYETEGWSVAELADMTGISIDAVKARLSRARRKTKAALQRNQKILVEAGARVLTGDGM